MKKEDLELSIKKYEGQVKNKSLPESLKKVIQKKLDKAKADLDKLGEQVKGDIEFAKSKFAKTYDDISADGNAWIRGLMKKGKDLFHYNPHDESLSEIKNDEYLDSIIGTEEVIVTKKEKKKAEPKRRGQGKANKPAAKKEDKPKGKIPMKYVEILWAEGETDKYDKFPKKYDTWEAANNAVIPVYKSGEPYGGYNKLKFKVAWDDMKDEEDLYGGRLDVSKDEDNPLESDGNVFGKHIKAYLTYLLNEPNRNQESKDEIKEFLETYSLSDKKEDKKTSKPAKSTSTKEPAKKSKSKSKKPAAQGAISEAECKEILAKWNADNKKKKESQKKSKRRSPATRVAANVVQGIETAIKSVPASEISNNPQKEIAKFERLIKAGREFMDAFKDVLGEEYSKADINAEFKELDTLVKELNTKYKS